MYLGLMLMMAYGRQSAAASSYLDPGLFDDDCQ